MPDGGDQAALLLEGGHGLGNAITGIRGLLLLSSGDTSGALRPGAFRLPALGPVVLFDGVAPGPNAGFDVVLVAAVLVVAREPLNRL
jgi:hypothetical protein